MNDQPKGQGKNDTALYGQNMWAGRFNGESDQAMTALHMSITEGVFNVLPLDKSVESCTSYGKTTPVAVSYTHLTLPTMMSV